MFEFISWSRASLALESAAKSATSGDERTTAHHLDKALRQIQGVRFNLMQVRALISLYDRVLAAAQSLTGTLPIRHCEEMKKYLEDYKKTEWPESG
jgi:hypothetical protein